MTTPATTPGVRAVIPVALCALTLACASDPPTQPPKPADAEVVGFLRIERTADALILKRMADVEEIIKLPSAQHADKLLRSCAHPQGGHLARMLPPHLMARAAERHDHTIRTAGAKVLWRGGGGPGSPILWDACNLRSQSPV